MAPYRCPTCQQVYGEPGYCPYDGQRLVDAPPSSGPSPSAQPITEVDDPDGVGIRSYSSGNDRPVGYDQLIGQTLEGRYIIERKIGEGGMGVVFAARHTVIERPLAIKVLKREVARDSSTIKRFVQEAQAASKIGHPNIVDVTDFGTTPDDLTYQVMEYVDGTTLGSAIKMSAPMPVERALPIAAQIASALGAAHTKGIVHRDLKPENVFLVNRDGRRDFVKIVDFGIAKVTQVDGAGGKAEGPRLTRAGAVFGTPEYMAPEQAAGRADIDGRVDIYALGTILYELLTGKVPHKSESMVRTLAMQMLDPIIPPSQARPDLAIDPDVEAVVMKALAKKRELRYATMADFADGLKSAAKGIELAQPVSKAVNVPALAAFALQAHPPGAVAPADQATWKPGPGPSMESRPPQSVPPPTGNLSMALGGPVGAVSAGGNTASGDLRGTSTRRTVNEPAFVTSPPRMTFDVGEAMAPPSGPPRRRWPVLLAAVLGLGIAGGAVALLLKNVEKAPGEPDASFVAEVDEDGGPLPPVHHDARIVVVDVPPDLPLDGGVETDGGRRIIVRPDRDARTPSSLDGGDGVVVRVVDGGGRTVLTPRDRGMVAVEIITRPPGGILMIGQTYRGPDGTHLEEPYGSRARITCTLPGHEPGNVDITFDERTEVALCTMKRIVRCLPGVKNPFDDCPDD